MPTLDTIRNLTVRGTSQGLDKVRSDLDAVSAAQGRVAASGQTMATVTDISSKRTLSASTALERLAAKHDETYRAQQQHARGTALLERATAQGLAGTKEFAIAQAAMNKLHEEAAGKVGLNRNQIAESVHVVKALGDEFASSGLSLRAFLMEGGRIGQIFTEGSGGVGGTMKAFGGILARAATGWIGLGVAAAGAAAVGVSSILAYENAQNRLATALEGTGRAAGLTVAQLGAVAEAGAKAGGISGSQGRDLAASFAHEGFGADLTQGLVGSAKRYGEITGTGTAEAGRALAEAFRDPERGIGELNKAFGFLDARLQTTVDRLTAQGNVEEARMVALDALRAAEASVTDHSWGLSRALAGAESSVSDWASKVGHSVATTFGFASDADKLKTDRVTLTNLQKVDPLGNADYIRELQTEIAGLERGQAAEVQKASAEADKARAREQSLLLDRAVRSALPDIDRERTLSDRATLLGRGLNTPGMAADLGVTGGQLRQAYENTATQLANLDPFKRMVQDAKLATDGIEAYTLAEHAAVDARRAELQVLREDGDLRRAALAGRIAENEAIAKANNAASDRLDQARQDRALIGLSPYERGLQEIKNQYEGVGGFFAKEGATRRELADAMKPVNDDLRAAGESVVAELRRIAQSMAAVQAPGASPFGTLDRGAFGGATPYFAAGAKAYDAAPASIRAMIDDAASKTGMPAGIIAALGQKENGFQLTGATKVLGADGRPATSAYGFGQLTNGAAADVSKMIPGFSKFDPNTAVLGAAEYLKIVLGRHGGDMVGALDAYGTGPGYGADVLRRAGGAAAGTMTVHGDAGAVQAPALLASTAMANNRASLGEKVAGYNQEQVEGPLKVANTALTARIDLLGAERAAVGQNTAAVQAAAEAQKLLSQYQAQDPTHALGAAAWQNITAGVDAYRSKLTSALQAEQDFQKQQQQLVGAMDTVREAGRGFLDPLVEAGLHGTSVLKALHSGLESVESKLAGRLEDTLIDSLLGAKGAAGGGLFGGGLSGLFGGGASAASGFGAYGPQIPGAASEAPGLLAGLGKMFGFAAGGYTGAGGRLDPAGIVHKGEYVFSQPAVSSIGVNVLHAMHTTGRLPGYADGGLVGGAMTASGSDMPSGDTHYHIDARGSTLTHAEMTSALTQAIASNNRALPGMLAERQRRTG